MVVHNPLELSTSNHGSFMWFNFKDRDMERNESFQMNESLTMSLRSNASESKQLLKPSENKENDMKQANSSNQVSFSELNDICEEKSFELNMENINSLLKMKE